MTVNIVVSLLLGLHLGAECTFTLLVFSSVVFFVTTRRVLCRPTTHPMIHRSVCVSAFAYQNGCAVACVIVYLAVFVQFLLVSGHTAPPILNAVHPCRQTISYRSPLSRPA